MQQFFAILKDSFREAVDGFVIYAMLVLALFMVVLVGSISFTPDAPDKALPNVLAPDQYPRGQFTVIFPDKGKCAAPTAIHPDLIKYSVDKAVLGGDGVVRFVLEVKKNSIEKTEEQKLAYWGEKEPFRASVLAWKKPPGEKIKNLVAQNKQQKRDERTLELVRPPDLSPNELEIETKAISDEDMAGFLKTQFSLFVGIPESSVNVTRKTEGVSEPNYQFDVELKGATTARGWPQTMKLFFGQMDLGDGWKLGRTVSRLQDGLVGWVGGTVTLIISVIITAFFIPNMLRKGSVDLLISKPIGRSQLLVYKYIGGLIFIFLITSVTVGLVWVVLSARAGYWNVAFLIMIPSLTFSFAILYAVSTAVAVFTRSAIASILVTIAVMFLLYGVGQAKSAADFNRAIPLVEVADWVYTVVDVLHAILPRYKDLDRLTEKLLAETNYPEGQTRLNGIGIVEYPSWGGALGVSLLFIAVMLGLSCWKFRKRDG